jgi:DNA repair exonuclease SbcCD ATPase subunit
VEALWGGTGGPAEALDAAVRWLADPALAHVEAALGAAGGGDADETPQPESVVAAQENDRRLASALADLHAREHELRELRAEWAEVTGDIEQATMDWLRERQDAETQLQAYRDRARELRTRLAQLESGGPDAPCPTCGRPLADHLKDVRVQLREEWESVVQDGSWWKRRREQLEGKPEHLRAIEGRGVRVNAAVESGAERVERVRASVRELEALRAVPPVPEADSPEARALERLAAELRVAAVGRVLREAGRLAERITAGRILWIRDADGGPLAEGIFHGSVPGARDRAAAELACRIASAALARAAGAPLFGMVVGEALDALDPEDRLRSVDVLAELADELGQVVVVTGTDLVELRPESFDLGLELTLTERGAPALRPLPVGVARLRLSA